MSEEQPLSWAEKARRRDHSQCCAGGCGEPLAPGVRGPAWCPACFQRITEEGDREREVSTDIPQNRQVGYPQSP